MLNKCVLDEYQENICIMTINRPESRNKLSIACMEEMSEILRSAEGESNCRAVILTSAGEYFCNGGDLGDYRVQSSIDIINFGSSFIKLHNTIINLSKPVIAAVQGHANGGGLNLVEACDLAVSSRHATFAVPEIRTGLAPMMAMAGLSRVLPRKGCMELSLLGESITAERALEIGLINRICEKEYVIDEAVKLANRIAERNPTAVALCKKLYSKTDAIAYNQKLEYGLNMLVSLLKSEDAWEALTANEENRTPKWKNK